MGGFNSAHKSYSPKNELCIQFSADGEGSICPMTIILHSVLSFQRMGRVAAVLLVLPLLASVGGEEEGADDGGGKKGENICLKFFIVI